MPEDKLLVKICGLQDPATAVAAVESGASAIGLVFAPSRRQVNLNRAAQICRAVGRGTEKVGVFVDSPLEEVLKVVETCGLDAVQLHGSEPLGYCRQVPCRVIKAFRVRGPAVLDEMAAYPGVTFLLDSYVQGRPGGTGQICDWQAAALAAQKYEIILAGGLTPENVQQAIQAVRPRGVDVSGGVETNGNKDLNKIRRFIKLAGEGI